MDLGGADLHFETLVVAWIGESDLSALRHRWIQPKAGEIRRETRVVRQRGVRGTRRGGLGLEESLRGGVHRDDVIVVVHHDDRIRHVPEDQIEAVALDADLFLGALQPFAAARQLLADVPYVGDVLQHRDRAAHADAIVRGGGRDDLIDELVAFDRIHEGHLAACRRPEALQVPGRESRGEQEVVHPDRPAFPGAVLIARAEQKLCAAVLQDHVVVRVGDEHRIANAVDHPPEPFLLDGVRFARVPKKVDVSLEVERLLRLPGEGNERLDVVLRDPRRAREQNDSRPLSAMLPARRGRDGAVLSQEGPLGRAPKRRRNDGSQVRPFEDLADTGEDPLVGRRIDDPLRDPEPQRSDDRIVRIGERKHELASDRIGDADSEASHEGRPVVVVKENDGPLERESPHELVEKRLERFARVARRRRRAPRRPLEEVSHRGSIRQLGALRRA